jgi:N-acetylglucosamine kinase
MVGRFFLGVDGGQSSTNAVISDERGIILGSGRGGPTKHIGESGGRESFMSAVRECVAEAAAQSAISPDTHFEAGCLGFSGGPLGKEEILRGLIRTRNMSVVSDTLVALAGATAGKPGIATIGGTGSASFGKNAAGQTMRAGGWGFSLGDQGSAYDISRQAIQAVMKEIEGWGPSTRLRPLLLEATGITDMMDAVRRFYTTEFPRHRIAGYAKLVDQAAQAGDEVAVRILDYAAHQLATITCAVRDRLFRSDESVNVVYVGGVFRSVMLREKFVSKMQAKGKNDVGPPRYGPTVGALIEALRSAGIHEEPKGSIPFDL